MALGGTCSTQGLARYFVIALAVLVMSVYLPQFYQKAFAIKRIQTRLLYSPVIKKFVMRERLKANKFINRDETGRCYDRITYETLMPFIFYRDMGKLGRLPLSLDGEIFTEDFIKKNRQVFEIRPYELPDHHPQIPLYPLFESQPDVAMLRFPQEVFRISDRIEFINARTNKINEELSQAYTDALEGEGFRFPARLIAGKATNLKPFDEGYFIVDARENVYHLKQVKGKPFCVKTTIPPDTGVKYIKVSENRRKEFYGLLITAEDRLALITYNNYRLIFLPLDGYMPDTMDFRLLVNPVCRTAIYSDDKTIYGVAMDTDYHPIARYKYDIWASRPRFADSVQAALFPFSVRMKGKTASYMTFDLRFNGWTGIIGTGACLVVYLLSLYICRWRLKRVWPDFVIIALTGIYGLISVAIVRPEP